MDKSVKKFYDDIAEYYHLIYSDWDESINRHASVLDKLIHKHGKSRGSTILDCACGIGTQTLGLAGLGYKVNGSDISDKEIKRAKSEAERRGLDIGFRTADFRSLGESFDECFDIVLAIDNALPHMIDKNDLRAALVSIYERIEKGGLFIASIRDYDEILKTKPLSPPPYIMSTPAGRRVVFQLWDWQDSIYHFTQYIIKDENGELNIRKAACEYRALTRAELMDELSAVEFCKVEWVFPEESGFYQPIVIAGKQ